jgi:hypothetical protein
VAEAISPAAPGCIEDILVIWTDEYDIGKVAKVVAVDVLGRFGYSHHRRVA